MTKDKNSFFREIIKFNSTEENYAKEESGRKRNTVRFTDDWTKDRWNQYRKAKYVCIMEFPKHDKGFIREITDKTEYKNVVIISW